jgi:hypothetical protein
MPRPNLRYVIEPQRREPGCGYLSCPEHAAQRWAVVEIKPRGGVRTINSFATKAEALAVSDTLNGNVKRRQRDREASREPGQRYGPLGVRGTGKIIASGGRDPARYQRFTDGN